MSGVGEILGAARLAELRAGHAAYPGMLASELAAQALASGGAVMREQLARFYRLGDDAAGSTLDEAARERCLLSLFAVRLDGPSFAVHVYAGLMAGLTPDQMAETVLLAAAYSGIDQHTTALEWLCRALDLLQRSSLNRPDHVAAVIREGFGPGAVTARRATGG